MPHFPTSKGIDAGETSTNGIPEHKKFMLITNPRTCSNLLVRILNLDKQPQTRHGGYHFLDALMDMCNEGLMDTDHNDWTDAQKQSVHAKYQASIDNLVNNLTPRPGEDTRISFTKEHGGMIIEPTALSRFVYEEKDVDGDRLRWQIPGLPTSQHQYSVRNQTIFPDSYLSQWTPIFLIRHPTRAFESIHRSFLDVFKTALAATATDQARQNLTKAFMTLRWTRNLYEFYISKGIEPILIDADDLVLNTKVVTQKLAATIGFDPDLLQYEWKGASEKEKEAKPAHLRRMLSTLDESAGVTADPNKLADSIKNPREQLPKWTEEFGEQTANDMVRWVEDAMPDYEWLKERRMRP